MPLPPVSATLTRALRLTAATAVLACTNAAMATAYYKWESVEMPAASGAACGNGSPFRIYVNRTPLTSKTVVVFEGGGACWDKGSCRGAHNREGVAANYMNDAKQMAALGLVTPFSARIDPLQSVQTQSWNMVYVPYCTGDVHSGDKVTTYTDGDPATPLLTHYHRGARNADALAAWLAKAMPSPEHLLVTGFSAGGAGATINYGVLRDAIKPKFSTLLADSGPLMQAPRGSSPEQAPSILLHTKIREVWGLDEPDGPISKMARRYPGLMDTDNMGSLSTALAQAYPQDRLGFAVFQADGVYTEFSYRSFYPDEFAATTSDEQRLPLLLAKWQPEVRRWANAMKPYPNMGYYIPFKRNLIDSHCLTAATFLSTGIPEAKLPSVKVFVDNLISRQGPVIKAYELHPPATPSFDTKALDFIVKVFGL